MPERGARITLGGRAPSLDLPLLLDALAGAACPEAAAPKTQRLLIAQDGCVTVNLFSAIRRLCLTPAMAGLAASAEAGFLRDCPAPPSRLLARVGAALPDGGPQRLSAAVRRLVAAVDAAIDGLVADGADLGALVLADAAGVIHSLAGGVGAHVSDHTDTSTRIGRAVFARLDTRRADREGEIARVTVAGETLELSHDGLARRFALAVGRLVADRAGDDARARQIEAGLLEAAREPRSRVSALIAFCRDDAVARVRARVCYAIMEALARRARKRPSPDDATRGLALYAGRALRLMRDATEGEGDGVHIAAAAHLGADFDFDLDKYVVRASFGRGLPVWPEWSSLLGEIEGQAGAPGARRDLAYRFRINGTVPGDGERTTAFVARIGRWREALDDGTLHPRDLALIVFLAAVVPEAPPPPDVANFDGADAPDRARTAAERVRTGGREAIAALLDELAARDKTLARMARALIRLLKSPAGDMLDEGASEVLHLHVCIRRDVVEASRLHARPDELLARSPEGADQKTVFFENLAVAETPLPGALFSFRVEVDLFGRGVHTSGERLEIESKRDISGPCVLALMQPGEAAAEDPGASAAKPSPAAWAAARIRPSFPMGQWCRTPLLRLLYEPRLLSRQKRPDEGAAQKLLFRQAGLAVLAAVCTRRLIERAGATRSTRVLVMRGAEPARADLVQAGEDVGYAVSQALELVLGRCWPVRVQGYEQRGDANQAYRLRGSLDALLGAFPVVQSGPDVCLSHDRLALMTVVSRPCDAHPELVDPDEETHLLLGRVYLAERGPADAVTMRLLRGIAAVHRADEAWGRQVSIVEALERLHADGVRDVVLLTHRFMGRQTGRSAPTHRHFETAGFQADMARRHPDLRLYRLVRHVFPALRLVGGRVRPGGPDMYEVVGDTEHHDRWMEASSGVSEGAMYGLVPFYSLATLRVVGDDDSRPQSGFVTYSALIDHAALGPAAFAANAALLGVGAEGQRLRAGVTSCLRALHYLEAERPARHGVGRKRYVQPVLDPYAWSTPARKEGIGEIAARPAGERRGAGGVVLSLPAMLERVMLVLDLLGEDDPARDPTPAPGGPAPGGPAPDGRTAGPTHGGPA